MELEVTLSKKAWHYKLQAYIFKADQPELYSLCPYFWLTIFCLLILPFVLIWKLCLKPIINYFESIYQHFEDKRFEQEKLFFQSLTIDQAVDVLINKKKINKTKYGSFWSITDLVGKWRWFNEKTNEEEHAFRSKIYNEYSKYEKQIEQTTVAKKQKKIAIKQKLQVNKIIKYTKLTIGIIVTLALILILFFTVKGLIHTNWHTFYLNFIEAVKVIGVLAVIIFFMAMIIIMCTNVKDHFENDADIAWYAYPAYWIACIIRWPFVTLWSIIKFIFAYFSATKDNYCPGIIWEEDAPIEK